MVVRLQIRHDIKSEWELYNPVLASGELGIETDNAEGQRIKIGDGNRAWIDLPFIDDKSVHKYADEEIYGNKIFHNSLLLRQGAEIPEGQILNGLADSASKDDEGNVIKDYYQPKIVVLDEITNETDWNTLIKEGIYKVNIDTWGTANTLHGPNEYIGNIYSRGILCVHANQGFITQVYYPYMESPIVYRNYNDVEWQTWGSISNLDRTIVHTTGDETIAGNKTFSNNVVLNNGNINFNLVGDALILKGGEPFIKKSTDNDTYLSASEGGSIHFRPNGDTSVEGEVIIDNQGIIQGKVTQDGAGNVITDTYARRDQMEEVANNEGLTAVFLGRNLLDNPSGYTEVKEMYRSTFDRAKFTIEGTPTITKDGIASGFSNLNKISTGNNSFDFSKSWEIQCAFIWDGFAENNNAGWSPNGIWQINGNLNTNKLSIEANSSKLRLSVLADIGLNIDSPNEINKNTIYYVKAGWDEKQYYLSISNDLIGWETVTRVSSSAIAISSQPRTIRQIGCVFDYADARFAFNGSIDLKQFSITVDGVEVFSGNKTGIDVIKQDNYEVVGSPVISEDGVASGFSTGNCLLVNLDNPITNKNKQLKIQSKAVLGEKTGTSVVLFHTDKTGTIKNGFTVQISDFYNTIWMNGYGVSGIAYNFQTGDIIEVEAIWDFQSFSETLNVLVNGQTKLTNTATFTSAEFSVDKFSISGMPPNGSYAWSGSIDLNSFKIYVDGNLVYQPCLRIPYNKTNAGVKISDIYYRDRIEDCYTYYNTANYFIIDEENKLYQIPYDVPDGHCVIIAQERNGINLYEYNTNLECTQTGSCTANTEFTFSIPYANDQYALSCPYSAKSRTGFTPTVTGDFISKGLIFLSDTQ